MRISKQICLLLPNIRDDKTDGKTTDRCEYTETLDNYLVLKTLQNLSVYFFKNII